ncbi:hypothetical protein [Azospirillum doebereinerae]
MTTPGVRDRLRTQAANGNILQRWFQARSDNDWWFRCNLTQITEARFSIAVHSSDPNLSQPGLPPYSTKGSGGWRRQ